MDKMYTCVKEKKRKKKRKRKERNVWITEKYRDNSDKGKLK